MRISDWSSDVCSSDLHLVSPPPGEIIYAPLQPRDQRKLNWQQGNCRGTQDGILKKHEQEDRQESTALKQGQHKGITRESPDRLDLLDKHRYNLTTEIGRAS